MPAGQASILQVIGLTLPAIALYLTVLTQLNRFLGDPKKAYKAEIPGSVSGHRTHVEHDESYDPDGVVNITCAGREWDFRFALGSFVVLVLAVILLIPTIRWEVGLLVNGGVVFAILGFLLLAVSLWMTIYNAYKNQYEPETGNLFF